MRNRGKKRVPQSLYLGGDTGLLRTFGELRALERERELIGESLEKVELLRQQHAARIRRQYGEHPQHCLAAFQWEIQRFRAGQRVGAQPSGLPMVLYPLRDVEIRAV